MLNVGRQRHKVLACWFPPVWDQGCILRDEGVDLAAFFRGSRFFDTTNGKLKGRIALVGSGRSLAQVMGTADGDVVVTMGGGSISGLIVSLAGLQIGNALVLFITGDNRIPISCAIGRLVFRNGVALATEQIRSSLLVVSSIKAGNPAS